MEGSSSCAAVAVGLPEVREGEGSSWLREEAEEVVAWVGQVLAGVEAVHCGVPGAPFCR